MKQTTTGTSAPKTALKENWEENLTAIPKTEISSKEDIIKKLDWYNLEIHKDASVIVIFSEQSNQFNELKDSIERNGLPTKFILKEGKLLSDINLYNAAKAAKYEFKGFDFIDYDYSGSTYEFLLLNILENNFSICQRLVIGVNLLQKEKEVNAILFSNKMKEIQNEGTTSIEKIDSTKKVAEQLGFSEGYLSTAQKISQEREDVWDKMHRDYYPNFNQAIKAAYPPEVKPDKTQKPLGDFSNLRKPENLRKLVKSFTPSEGLKILELTGLGITKPDILKTVIDKVRSHKVSKTTDINISIDISLKNTIERLIEEQNISIEKVLSDYINNNLESENINSILIAQRSKKAKNEKYLLEYEIKDIELFKNMFIIKNNLFDHYLINLKKDKVHFYGCNSSHTYVSFQDFKIENIFKLLTPDIEIPEDGIKFSIKKELIHKYFNKANPKILKLAIPLKDDYSVIQCELLTPDTWMQLENDNSTLDVIDFIEANIDSLKVADNVVNIPLNNEDLTKINNYLKVEKQDVCIDCSIISSEMFMEFRGAKLCIKLDYTNLTLPWSFEILSTIFKAIPKTDYFLSLTDRALFIESKDKSFRIVSGTVLSVKPRYDLIKS